MKLLITGSRNASERMLDEVDIIVSEAKGRGWEILVGDADGVDSRVIKVCDYLGGKITVFGAYHHMRNSTKMGVNLPTGLTYPQRDKLMARLCDLCYAVWDGESSGTKLTYTLAKKYYNKKVKIFTEKEGWK
jgi:hypothetical protein